MKKNLQAVAPVPVALIGCGAVSQLYYAPALERLQKKGLLELTGAYDPERQRLASIIARFPSASPMTSPEDFSGQELVIVASPPRFHAEQSIEALKAGLAVLCEKPLASTLREAEQVVAQASASQKLLAVGLVRRFFPSTEVIQRILTGEILGSVEHVACFEGGPFRWPACSTSFFDRSAGGGVLIDIGVHLLDLLLGWLGSPASIQYEDDAMGGVEANCHLTMAFEGFLAEARLSRDWELPNEYVFRCSKGWLRWAVAEPDAVQIGFHGSNQACRAHLHNTEIVFGSKACGLPGHNFEQSFVRQVENVVKSIRGSESLKVPGQHGIESLRMIEACYGNRKLMRMGWLGEPEQTIARSFASER